MALKPTHLDTSLTDEIRRISQAISDIVESTMTRYVNEVYRNQYVLERFTEDSWHVAQKSSKDPSYSLKVVLCDFSKNVWYPNTKGYYLKVSFSNVSRFDFNHFDDDETNKNSRKAVSFIEELFNLTRLPIRVIASDGEMPYFDKI
ncbi:MAG: hypothetical protein U0Z26_15020 [Anaerolineales bacterium]